MKCCDLSADILDGLNASLAVTDPASLRVVEVNAAAEVLFGRSRDELIGRPRADLLLRREEPPNEPIPFPPASGRVRDAQVLLARRDGSLVPVAWSVVPVTFGGAPLLAEVFFDVAERRILQRRRGMAQRLEAIGGLAAGIAHEINTPVQYIGDSLSFLRDAGQDMARLFDLYRELEQVAPKTPELAPIRERIRELAEEIDLEFLIEETPRARQRALEGVARITDIVLAMKRFAHPGGEEKRPADVNKLVSDTATVTRNEWKYAADLTLDLDPDLPLVPVHAGDISQVLLNLVVNAAHALADSVGDSGKKGQITARTRGLVDRILISVSDNGPGVPQALQERVFEPFFTTKEVGRGTGQGLALVHDIVVNKHGGTVRLDSGPEGGATFIVELPLGSRNEPGVK